MTLTAQNMLIEGVKESDSITVAQGFHSLTREMYDRVDAMNYSRLKHMGDCPARFRYNVDNPEPPSDALQFGNAFHLGIFEPARFAAEVVRSVKFDGRSNAGKAAIAAFEESNADKIILKPDEYDSIAPMAKALWDHPATAELLGMPGTNEHSMVWRDQTTKELCKGRMDSYKATDCMIIDPKTTRSARHWEFRKDILKFGYDIQAAMYVMGCEAITGKPHRFTWLAVEKKAPYICAAYELDERSMEMAKAKVCRLLALYVNCSTFNSWPSYFENVQEISLPDYAMLENDDE